MRNPVDLLLPGFEVEEEITVKISLYQSAFIVKFDNIHYSMIEDAEEFYNANSLEKCF